MASSQRTDKTSQAGAMSDDDAAAVMVQLEKIIRDPLFSETTRMKRFLRYVTEEALAGRSARLKGYTIGLEVFDRPEDFDPQGDTIVRVQAGQLRRRLDLYYSGSGQDDPIRLTIPKGRYSPSFEFRTLLLEEEVAKPAPILQLVETSRKRSLRPGLAVLTLDNLSTEDYGDFFAEGLTSEIVSALVQFKHIRVVAIRPTVAVKTEDLTTQEIAEKFNAGFVLSGHVRRAGEVFRVTVNLIMAETGQVLFGKTFDRKYTPDQLFDLQESIASHVAALIAAPFGQINRHNRRRQNGRRTSMPAYEAVLRFYDMGLSPKQEDALELLKIVEDLTREYKSFSTGYAIRALIHVFLCAQCVPRGDKRANLDAATSLAQTATRIDPQNALGYFARYQAAFHDGKIEEADRMAQRALALNPNDYLVLAYIAVTEAYLGRVETATALHESATNLVGYPPEWFKVAPLILALREKRYEHVVEETGSIDSSASVGLFFLKIVALGHLGRKDEALAILQSLSKGNPDYIQEAILTSEYWYADKDLTTIWREGWAKLGLDS